MTTKKSGEYQLSCGHVVRAVLDTQSRYRCSTCNKEVFVVRVVK